MLSIAQCPHRKKGKKIYLFKLNYDYKLIGLALCVRATRYTMQRVMLIADARIQTLSVGVSNATLR